MKHELYKALECTSAFSTSSCSTPSGYEVTGWQTGSAPTIIVTYGPSNRTRREAPDSQQTADLKAIFNNGKAWERYNNPDEHSGKWKNSQQTPSLQLGNEYCPCQPTGLPTGLEVPRGCSLTYKQRMFQNESEYRGKKSTHRKNKEIIDKVQTKFEEFSLFLAIAGVPIRVKRNG